ncbi:FCD domain-containing protein, partial [Burkholderia cenocepacia]
DVGREHEDIVKAVIARDADRACKLLRQHFAVTAQLVLEDTTPADGTAPAMRAAAGARARR